MRKRLLSLLMLPVLLLSLLQLPAAAAVTPLETDRSCSLTVTFAKDGVGFSGLEAKIYRVAGASADGTFDLIAPFSSFPVNIHGITSQQEWKTVATTLRAYITANAIAPDRTAVSNETGAAAFSGLSTGLYLVMGVIAENDTGIYEFEDFMVYLPTPLEDGSFDYDLEARPKPAAFTPKTRYQVTKLWKDSGYTSRRPDKVLVDIYKDGVLQETVELNAANNWTYTWNVPKDGSKWTAVERDVPKEYQVTITVNGAVITITNVIRTSDTPPKTGDTFPLWPYVAAMSLSGCLLILLGTWRRRKSA